jgi:hypothetical protein
VLYVRTDTDQLDAVKWWAARRRISATDVVRDKLSELERERELLLRATS